MQMNKHLLSILKTRLKSLSFVIATAGLATSGIASAAPPASIRNTTWTLQTNRESVQLLITTQGGPGAPGAATCRTINGELGIAPPTIEIHGWYCPSTGRIHFLHKNLHSDNAVRAFTGNVSDEAAGQPLYMAGTMMAEDASHGTDLGEFNFSAVTVE
jgi:hypothetical protein